MAVGAGQPSSRAIAEPTGTGSPLPGEVRSFPNSNGTAYRAMWVYNGTGAALVARASYRLIRAGAAATDPNPRVDALAALMAVYQDLVVAVTAIPNAAWGWAAIDGDIQALVKGASVTAAAGDTLIVTAATSTTHLMPSGGTTLTTGVFGYAKQAATTDTQIYVALRGIPAILA